MMTYETHQAWKRPVYLQVWDSTDEAMIMSGLQRGDAALKWRFCLVASSRDLLRCNLGLRREHSFVIEPVTNIVPGSFTLGFEMLPFEASIIRPPLLPVPPS